MTAIRVVRQGKKGKTDRLPLYVEFYINREKIRIAVRLSVTSKEWDEQNEVIKGRDKESKDKNLIISNIRSRGLSLKPWGIALKFLFLHHENILFPND